MTVVEMSILAPKTILNVSPGKESFHFLLINFAPLYIWTIACSFLFVLFSSESSKVRNSFLNNMS